MRNHYSMYSEEKNKKELERIQVERIVTKSIQYWPLFVISVVLCFVIGFFYLKYATPFYYSYAKVLIKDEQRGESSEGQIFQDLGINSGVANVDNEIEIMKSRLLMQEVVRVQHLYFRYFVESTFSDLELYKESPVAVTLLSNEDSFKQFHVFQVEATGDRFILSDGDNKWVQNWGDTINTAIGSITVNKGTSDFQAKKIKVLFTPVEVRADMLLGALNIEAVNKQVSIINLRIQDNIPERGEDILNTLIAVYLQANIDDRNKVSVGTIEFIDERLELVEKELNAIETDIEEFKQANKIVNINDQSRLLLDNTSEYNRELSKQTVQLDIITSLEKYIINHNDRIVPSTFLLQDMTLTKLIERYNLLQAQRQNMLISSTKQNPYVVSLDNELSSLRQDMLSNLASLKNNISITVRQLEKQTGYINSNIDVIPEKERIYLEYSRRQSVMQELYLFLLKKREETAISKSSTSANARVLEPAHKDGAPFSPTKSKVYLVSFSIGLLIPATYVLIREIFNVRIKTIDDIKSVTDMPVIGEIGHNRNKEIVVVEENSKTIVSEQFRTLRTNIQFLLTEKDDKVIMITSSMGGEGKSFISINLSSALSLSGKKVVLLELDLRKPKVSQHLGIDNKIGFSDYAINKATIDEIIKPSGVADNFYVISSGQIPPNPAELIMLPHIEKLFARLKENFDYIVIDTSPVGLVTDAQLLEKHADAVLYIVRQNYTYKQQVKFADELHKTGKMMSMSIVVNDVKMGGKGYGYRYGYGNGYYAEDHNKKGIKKLFERFQQKV